MADDEPLELRTVFCGALEHAASRTAINSVDSDVNSENAERRMNGEGERQRSPEADDAR